MTTNAAGSSASSAGGDTVASPAAGSSVDADAERGGMERRIFPRLRLTPGYSAAYVQVIENGVARILDGHVYDVSEGGVRIELDEALPIGTDVSICLQLSGAAAGIFAAGNIVRVFDDGDDPGPRRMALSFRRFLNARDRVRLREVLHDVAPAHPGRPAAAA